MTAFAYYNEIDPVAAEWLRWLIAQRHIASGFVDTRSIIKVQPDDLIGFTQVHLFAGIGGWSYAARLAGWPDDRALWSASCPCQPFSVAGKGAGVDDERHLWPHVIRLVRARRPAKLVGEQVAGKAGYGWFDGVGADLARENYASRAVDIPSCAVDAPHIRNRIYWFAEALEHAAGHGWGESCGQKGWARSADANVYARGEGPRHLGDAEGLGRGEGIAEPMLWSGRSTLAGADAPERIGFADNRKLLTQCEYFSVSCGRDECDSGCRKSDRRTQFEWDCAREDGALANAESEPRGRDEPQRRPEGRAVDGRPDARHRNAGNLADAQDGGLPAGPHQPGGGPAPLQSERQDGGHDVADAAGRGRQVGGRSGAPGQRQAQFQAVHDDDACASCGGAGAIGPFFPGGMSTICGNCDVGDAIRIGRPASGNDHGCDDRGQLGAADQHGRSLADPDCQRREELRRTLAIQEEQPRPQYPVGGGRNGTFWSDFEWIVCHDGKARRAQPGVPMLVDGLPGRVAAWRGFGNAINPVLAAEVIAAFMDAEGGA